MSTLSPPKKASARTASPSHARPRPIPNSSTQQPQSRAPAQTPGIINLPPKHSAPTSSSTADRSSQPAQGRHVKAATPASPRARSRAAANPTTAAPSEGNRKGTQANGAQSEERSGKGPKTRSSSPLKPSSTTDTPPAAPHAAADAPTTNSPAVKQRKRGGKANRQTSPPLPLPLSDPVPIPSQPTPGSLLLEGLFPPSLLSRSAPLDFELQRPSSVPNFTTRADDGDGWDMPVGANGSRTDALNWQQEGLHHSASSSAVQKTTRQKSGSLREPAGGRNGRKASAMPAMSVSADGAALNWQQQLFQQDSPASNTRSFNSTSNGNSSPAVKNRRQQNRDEMTFGMDGLNLGGGGGGELAMDDPYPSTPQKNSSTPQRQPRSHHQNVATPTKAVEPRYAGPTFHNSPAPSSLPTPSFLLRRQAGGSVVA